MRSTHCGCMNMEQPSCNDLNYSINGWEAFGSITPNVIMSLCGYFRQPFQNACLSLLLQLQVSLMFTVTESLASVIIICEGHGDSNLVGSASKLCFLLFLFLA